MLLKRFPEDFRVEEVLNLDVKDRGDYAYFILEKTKWTTMKALDTISKQVQVSVKRFAVCGQKDRQGITRQYVSVYQVSERALEKVKIKDIKIEFVGYGDSPLAIGLLEGNKFNITVRELEKPLRKVSSVVNYFDDQRFGGYRPNMHLVGKAALQGRYEDAVKLLLLHPFPNETKDYVSAREKMEENWGKWDPYSLPRSMTIEKKVVGYLQKKHRDFKGALRALPRQLFIMLTHSYQSYIYNKSLAMYLRHRFREYREVEYSLGKMIFVQEFEDLDWPIVGYETELNRIQKRMVEKVMREENIWYDTFRATVSALSSEGLTRKAMIKVKNFKLGEYKDGVQEVSFFLPKGSYATVVMKALS